MAHAVLDFSRPHILRTEAEHAAALDELDRLMRSMPTRGSEDGDRLEFLMVLIKDYEARNVKLAGKSTPRSIVEFAADQHDLTRGELARLMGGRSSLSLFLKGRPLSTGQISRLHARLGIPPELLFEPRKRSVSRTSSLKKRKARR